MSLFQAAEACRRILEFTRGIDLAAYLSSELVRSAVERQFEIAGEALTRVLRTRPQLREHLPEAERVVAFRNRVIHGYDEVDDELVWATIQDRVPGLLTNLRRTMEELGT